MQIALKKNLFSQIIDFIFDVNFITIGMLVVCSARAIFVARVFSALFLILCSCCFYFLFSILETQYSGQTQSIV